MPTHPIPTAPYTTWPGTRRDDALRYGLATIIGWYRRDGAVPVEALQLLAADPIAADAALTAAPASGEDPLTTLRRLTQPVSAGCRCSDDYECDGGGS